MSESLFDEPDAESSSHSSILAGREANGGPRQCGVRPASGWSEVAEGVYNSWPPRKQLAYCAVRDEAAAANPANNDMVVFFRERAQTYREMM